MNSNWLNVYKLFSKPPLAGNKSVVTPSVAAVLLQFRREVLPPLVVSQKFCGSVRLRDKLRKLLKFVRVVASNNLLERKEVCVV